MPTLRFLVVSLVSAVAGLAMLAGVASARPFITSLSPTSGPPGTTVVIQGNNFGPGARGVWFGTTPAAAFSSDSFFQVTAVAPSGVTGTVDVRVIGNGDDASQVNPDARFTFTDPPPPPAAEPPPPPAPRVSPFACRRVPSLIGRTVTGARRILARDACAVIVRTSGPTRGTRIRVARQSIAPGTPLLQSGTLTLTLRERRSR